MAYVKVWDPLILVFTGVIITLLLIGVGLFLYRAHQRKVFNERLLLYGFAIFFNQRILYSQLKAAKLFVTGIALGFVFGLAPGFWLLI